MKSLVETIKEIVDSEKEQTKSNMAMLAKSLDEVKTKMEETELQQTEILVNQEYHSCLLELQEQED